MKWTNENRLRLQVYRRDHETRSILSLYLRTLDGTALPPFAPGQYIAVYPPSGGSLPARPGIYSLSDAPGTGFYRISVKRVENDGGPHCSIWLHDMALLNSTLEVSLPDGSFVLPAEESPVVLLSAGIGITPVLSMAKHLAASGFGGRVLVLHGVANSHALAFARELNELRRQAVTTALWFSQPLPSDIKGQHFDFSGRIQLEAMAAKLPAGANYFVCGPPAFLSAMRAQLAGLSIPPRNIHTESFQLDAAIQLAPLQKPSTVKFARSGLETQWTGQHPNLLVLAEKSGLNPPYLCRLGQCGQCESLVLSGSVTYPEDPTAQSRFGGDFICLARPVGDVVLDI